MKQLIILLLLCLSNTICLGMESPLVGSPQGSPKPSFTITEELMRHILGLFPQPQLQNPIPTIVELNEQAQQEADPKKKAHLLIRARLLSNNNSTLIESLDRTLKANPIFILFCRNIARASFTHKKAQGTNDRLILIQQLKSAAQNYLSALELFPTASNMTQQLQALITIRSEHRLTTPTTDKIINQALEICKLNTPEEESSPRELLAPPPTREPTPEAATASPNQKKLGVHDTPANRSDPLITHATSPLLGKKRVDKSMQEKIQSRRPHSASLSSDDLPLSLAQQAAERVQQKSHLGSAGATIKRSSKHHASDSENEMKLDLVFGSLTPQTSKNQSISCIQHISPNANNIGRYWVDTTGYLLNILLYTHTHIPKPRREVPHQENSQYFSLLMLLLERANKAEEAAKKNGAHDETISAQLEQLRVAIKEEEADYCDGYYWREGTLLVLQAEKLLNEANDTNRAQMLVQAYQLCTSALQTFNKSCKAHYEGPTKSAIEQATGLAKILRSKLATTPEFEEYTNKYDVLQRSESQIQTTIEQFLEGLTLLPYNAELTSIVDELAQSFWLTMQPQLEFIIRAQIIIPTQQNAQRLQNISAIVDSLFNTITPLSASNAISSHWPTMREHIRQLPSILV